MKNLKETIEEMKRWNNKLRHEGNMRNTEVLEWQNQTWVQILRRSNCCVAEQMCSGTMGFQRFLTKQMNPVTEYLTHIQSKRNRTGHKFRGEEKNAFRTITYWYWSTESHWETKPRWTTGNQKKNINKSMSVFLGWYCPTLYHLAVSPCVCACITWLA